MTSLERHALMHKKISEATVESQSEHPAIYQKGFNDDVDDVIIEKESLDWDSHFRPRGEAIALLDCMIMIIEYFKVQGWDIKETIEIKERFQKT